VLLAAGSAASSVLSMTSQSYHPPFAFGPSAGGQALPVEQAQADGEVDGPT
jgi:hypothetical protein